MLNNPILLYHSCFEDVPKSFEGFIHNIAPELVVEQVQQVARDRRFISLSEFLSADKLNGCACVTFDDGYRNIFETVIPVLLDLGIPVTIFLSGAMLEGKGLWRDRVRFLINAGLVSDFVSYLHSQHCSFSHISSDNFYRCSKDPVVNSKYLDRKLCSYLQDHFSAPELQEIASYSITSGELPDHPLVTYGSHGYDHYVLSSLTEDEQEQDIIQNEMLLESVVPQNRLIKAFALPFGGTHTVNTTTFDILAKRGYEAVLFSRSCHNSNTLCVNGNLKLVERWIVPADMHSFHKIFGVHPLKRVLLRSLRFFRSHSCVALL